MAHKHWLRALGRLRLMTNFVVGAASADVAAAEPTTADEADEADEKDAKRIGDRGESYVVTAPPPPPTTSTRHVDAMRISQTPKRSADDLLRLVPGLYISQHGTEGKGQQIYLRGFDAVHGSDVEVLVAGVPINELSNVHGQGYVDLNFIIPEVVRGIDATKGPFRLDQGNFATAGTVSFDLGVERDNRGARAAYEIGSTNRHRGLLLWAPRKASESSFIAIEGMHDEGFGENRGSERLSGLGQWRVAKGDRWFAEVLASAYTARFGEPGAVPMAAVDAGLLDFYDTYTDDTRGESDRGVLGVRLRGMPSSSMVEVLAWLEVRRLALQENFTGFLIDPIRGDRRLQSQDAAGSGARACYELFLASALSLLAGVDWKTDVIDQFEDQIDADHQSWQRNRDLDITQHAAAAYVGARWFPMPPLRLEGGGRIDVFHFSVRDRLQGGAQFSDTLAQVSPRLSSSWEISPRWSMLGAYGRGLRAPEARAVTNPSRPNENVSLMLYQGGEPRITTSDSGELGVRFRPTGALLIGATGFGTWISNESVYDHVSGLNLELNRTRRIGGEAEFAWWPWHWLRIQADLTGVDARFVESGNPVPGAPRVFATADAGVVHPSGARAGARAIYVAPRPLAHGARAGAIAVADVMVGWRWRNVELDLFVDNITNARWRDGEFHYASWFDQSEPRSEIPTIHYTAGTPLAVRGALTGWF